MKKFIMGIALVAALLCAASCGSRSAQAVEESTDSTAVADSAVVDSLATPADTVVAL